MISYAVNESSAILRIVLSLLACTMVDMARDHDVGIPGMCIYSLCQSQHAWPRQPDRLSRHAIRCRRKRDGFADTQDTSAAPDRAAGASVQILHSFFAELPYESLDARIVEERRSRRCHSRFNNLASPNALDVFVYVQIGVYFAICVAISRLSIYRLKTAQIWHTGSLLRAFLPARVQKISKDTAVSLAAAPSACYVTLR